MVKFNICSRFLVILSKTRIFVTWQNFQKSQKMIKMKQKLNTSRTKHAIHTKIHRKLYQLCALKVANSPNEIGWRSATFEVILLFDKLYIFTQLLASKLITEKNQIVSNIFLSTSPKLLSSIIFVWNFRATVI